MSNRNNFYVYMHKRKDNNEIFYVGKGRNGRAYQKAYRNKQWQMIADSVGFYNEFAEKNLSEEEAFQLEKDLISQIGITNLTNINLGGDGGVSRDNPIAEELQRFDELFVLLDMLNNFDELYKESKWFRDKMKTLVFIERLRNEAQKLLCR